MSEMSDSPNNHGSYEKEFHYYANSSKNKSEINNTSETSVSKHTGVNAVKLLLQYTDNIPDIYERNKLIDIAAEISSLFLEFSTQSLEDSARLSEAHKQLREKIAENATLQRKLHTLEEEIEKLNKLTIKSHKPQKYTLESILDGIRDKDTGDICGIDETDYLFNLSEKNAIILKSALQEIEEGKGRVITLDELREELGFEEEKE
jgi:hypothetical protein